MGGRSVRPALWLQYSQFTAAANPLPLVVPQGSQGSAWVPAHILLGCQPTLGLKDYAEPLQRQHLRQHGVAGGPVQGAALSAVSPLLEMQITTSPGASWPQEPCTASVPWRKQAGVPVELSSEAM